MNFQPIKFINTIIFGLLIVLLLAFPLFTNKCFDNNTRLPNGELQLVDTHTWYALDFAGNNLPEEYAKAEIHPSLFNYRLAALAAIAILLTGLIFQLFKVSRLNAVMMVLACIIFIICEITIDNFKNFYFEYCTIRLFSNSQTVHTENNWQWGFMNGLAFTAFFANLFFVLFPLRFERIMRLRRVNRMS